MNKFIKFIRKHYYMKKLRQFDNSDLYAHIGYFTNTPEEYAECKEELDKKRKWLVMKIRQYS